MVKRKKVNGLFTDSYHSYLFYEKGIMVYDKHVKTLHADLNIQHPLDMESDLNHGFLIILNTLNCLTIYRIQDFKLDMQIELGAHSSSSNFIYYANQLCVFAANTDLDKKQFTLYKIDLKTKEISIKIFERLSLAVLCYIEDEKLFLIEEKIVDTPEDVSYATLNTKDFSLMEEEKTSYKIGPLFRISSEYCYDFFGLFDFRKRKYTSFEKLGIHVRSASSVKYYNEKFYIFAGRDTYILSKELKIIEHFYNEDIEEWIIDMLVEEDYKVIIRTSRVQIIN